MLMWCIPRAIIYTQIYERARSSEPCKSNAILRARMPAPRFWLSVLHTHLLNAAFDADEMGGSVGRRRRGRVRACVRQRIRFTILIYLRLCVGEKKKNNGGLNWYTQRKIVEHSTVIAMVLCCQKPT